MKGIPSQQYVEAERVRRAAMRSLRAGFRSRITSRALAELAGCERQVAANALQTLKAQKLIAEREVGSFALTEQGRGATAV